MGHCWSLLHKMHFRIICEDLSVSWNLNPWSERHVNPRSLTTTSWWVVISWESPVLFLRWCPVQLKDRWGPQGRSNRIPGAIMTVHVRNPVMLLPFGSKGSLYIYIHTYIYKILLFLSQTMGQEWHTDERTSNRTPCRRALLGTQSKCLHKKTCFELCGKDILADWRKLIATMEERSALKEKLSGYEASLA